MIFFSQLFDKTDWYIIGLIILILVPAHSKCDYNQKYKVGLLIVATGRYIEFVPPLIRSAKKYFCTNHEVTFFVFTDGPLEPDPQVITTYQKRIGWPYDSLLRCTIYYEHADILKDMDYLFACDADMLFVDAVGSEILGDRVATQHPGFVGRRGSYENRSISTAYVARNEGKFYFAGGFHGGTYDEFLHLITTMTRNIKIDQEHGIMAIWHDESHLNRYFINNPPTVILNPSYCYPSNRKSLPYPRKLLALDKDHAAYRR